MADLSKDNYNKTSQKNNSADKETLLVSIDQLSQVVEVMQTTMTRIKNQINGSFSPHNKADPTPTAPTTPLSSSLSTKATDSTPNTHSTAIKKALAERKMTVLH